MSTVTLPARFNGPPRSANGGYACGVVASFADGPVRVALKAPPPLEHPLTVATGDDGALELRDGTVVVASATLVPAGPALDVPRVVDVEEAADAVDDYVGWDHHVFPTCWVCGPDRGDGLRLFPGPVDEGLVASPWIPDRSLDRGDGHVEAVFVWAALDCPSYFGVAAREPAVLAELSVSLAGDVAVGEPHVVLGWAEGRDDRSFHAGSAILSRSGEVLATGRARWAAVSDAVLARFL